MKTQIRTAEPVSRTIQARGRLHQAGMAEVLQAYRNQPAQLAVDEEDDRIVQGKFATQLQDEEEETLQGKIVAQLQSADEEEPVQQKVENRTGLPDRLKNGVENLSGYSLDAVKVHYNSSKPAQLQALAYTQGRDIHVGPGQERYLGHEAWHVVQQMQGRVQPTTQLQGIAVNDNEGLEREADVMGGKAVQCRAVSPFAAYRMNRSKMVMQMRFLDNAKYKTFIANTYTKEYDGDLRSDNRGTGIGFAGFKATYQPSAVAEKLYIELPIKFDPAFPADEAKYYMQNVERTWSDKFHLKTKDIKGGEDDGHGKLKEAGDNKWDQLNDVNVIVRAKETTGVTVGKNDAKFNLTHNVNDEDYVSHDGSVKLSEQGYEETRDSNSWWYPSWLLHHRNLNVYGHETGHMFGLDDEYQVGNGDYIVRRDIKAYNKANNTIKVYPINHNEIITKHWGKDYRIWLLNGTDVMDPALKEIKLNRDGVSETYTFRIAPTVGKFILLNDTQKTRSDALPGTLTDHYNLTKKALGTDYANQNAVMDNTNKNKTIMGAGTKVKKHHYVTFWDAMVQAIRAQYPVAASEEAPNQHDDWQII